MPKFFVTTNQIKNNTITILNSDVNHIANVLRLKCKDEIVICNNDSGITYKTIIDKIEKESIECKIKEIIEENVETSVDITIFQGLPKADKMEYIIQKNVELGAFKIVPVAMARSIVKLDKKSETKKIERWQKISESAAKQSKRDVIPTIENPITIEKLSKQIHNFDLVLVAYENEKAVTLKQELQKQVKNEELKIGIVIGPEGGLDEKEVEQLINNGAKTVTLGKRILRTETAAICCLSNIMYEYEM